MEMLREAMRQYPKELLVWAFLSSSLSFSCGRSESCGDLETLPQGTRPLLPGLGCSDGKCVDCQWLESPDVE